uniref:Medium-chain acyl-CoA ligase ACSF2, mitochondrial n=1 Tax=Phlebotomus papatasi TaxID=29031 RepID=A0A1B0D321_PHLPP
MTENSAVSFHTLPDDTDEQVLESVGHVQDNIEAKVIDNEGNLVPFGVPGELCVRGYFTMLGYWDDEEKTRETLGKDGWLRTGDQFVLQADGYGKIVGRLKEMIIRGGENIFPKEIENFLATCPQIAEAHIVGVPDERLGEELCAFVRLRAESGSFTENDIKDFCKGKISFHKIPRYIEIVTDFPKTLSGKIQKFKLQQQFEEKFRNVFEDDTGGKSSPELNLPKLSYDILDPMPLRDIPDPAISEVIALDDFTEAPELETLTSNFEDEADFNPLPEVCNQRAAELEELTENLDQ